MTQRRLAAARRPHDRDELPGLDDKVDVVEDKGFGLGIAEAQVPKFDPAFDRTRVGEKTIVARLKRRQRDVAQALQVQVEDAELDRFLDQQGGLLGEVPLVAHQGEDHPDRQGAIERQPGREIDRQHVLYAEYRVVQRLEGDGDPSHPDVGVDEIGIAVHPLAFALVLAIEQLDALDCPHGFDEGRVLLRPRLDDILAAPAKLLDKGPSRRIA